MQIIKCLMTNNLFLVVVVLSLFDIFLGTTRAFLNKEVSSNINKTGITNHIITILTIIVMYWVLTLLDYGEFCTGFILFYIGSYAISIVENLGRMGIRFPKKLEDIFIDLQKEDREEVKSDDH